MEIEGEMFEIGFGELRGFADGLKMGCKRKIGVRDYTEILTLSNLKKLNCH